MAIVDKKLVVSDEQAVTATAVSTDKLDFGAADALGFGEGTQVRCVVLVTTALSNAADDGTVTFQVVDASADNLTTDQGIIVQTGAIPEATLVKGFRVELPIPGATDLQRYVGVRYLVGGTGNLNAGAVSAWFEAL